MEQHSDCSRVVNWLQRHGIPYYTTELPPDTDRVRRFGPHIYTIEADGLHWEFLPSGCLERFTISPDNRLGPVVPIEQIRASIRKQAMREGLMCHRLTATED